MLDLCSNHKVSEVRLRQSAASLLREGTMLVCNTNVKNDCDRWIAPNHYLCFTIQNLKSPMITALKVSPFMTLFVTNCQKSHNNSTLPKCPRHNALEQNKSVDSPAAFQVLGCNSQPQRLMYSQPA